MEDYEGQEIMIGSRVKMVNVDPRLLRRATRLDRHAMAEVIGFVWEDNVGQVCMLKFPGRSRYMKVAPQYLHVCRDDKEPSGVSFQQLMDGLMAAKK